MTSRINHVAVWVLTAVYLLINFVWYKALGNAWLNYHARTKSDIEMTHDYKAYLLAIVAALFLNYALAWLIGKTNSVGAAAGAKIAVLAWLAFLFVQHATIAVFSAFETNPWPIVLIDMGWLLIAFALSGAVLGGWRKASGGTSWSRP